MKRALFIGMNEMNRERKNEMNISNAIGYKRVLVLMHFWTIESRSMATSKKPTNQSNGSLSL